MKRLRDLYARSRRLPVRVRIALVSAALTAVILIGFAAVVGRLVSNRLHDDFEKDLQAQAGALSAELAAQIQENGQPTGFSNISLSPDAQIRIVYADGTAYRAPPGSNSLGAPDSSNIVEVDGLDVASEVISVGPDLSGTSAVAPQGTVWVQYARPETAVTNTIERLWLFLAGGVAIGTVLAGLAGTAVANRAMRPIASLTATARDIATTRDPSRRVPQPESDDEVAELARTLEDMLRELDAARTETEATIERQREFVADASHELRTPLTSILANLELLEHELEDGIAEQTDMAAVASALRSSKRMNRLVADLLLLARADAGRAGVRTDADLARIAREAVEEVAPVAADHELSTRIADSVPVDGSPDELHRMVLNLLENAVRHTPAGTRVWLRVDAAGDRAKLVVADDGPGLPEGLESQVFERFVRGGGPADRSAANGTGTGLGLSIVRAVAVAHGGRVVADRSKRGGARFTVTMPLAPDAIEPEEPEWRSAAEQWAEEDRRAGISRPAGSETSEV